MNTPNAPGLAAENAELRARLEEAEETLRAIRAGEVDALVMGEEVYTLKGAERPYRLLIESMNEGAATVTRDGTVLYCNQRFAQMAATTTEQIIGSCLCERVVPEHQAAVRALVASALHGGTRAEFIFSSPEGPGLPFQMSLRPLYKDAETIAVVAADLSERKRHESELRQLNQKLEDRVHRRTAELQAILDTAPIGLAIAQDPEGLHIRGNPANEKMYGLERGEELSRRALEPARYRTLKDGRELPVDQLPMQRAVRGETVMGQIIDVVRADGRTLTVYCNAAPLLDERNHLYGAVGAFLDISELKRAQEALRESEQRLKHAQQVANVGSWEWDLQSGALWWSEQTYRQMGEEPGWFTPTRDGLQQRIHPEDRAAFDAAVQSALEGTGLYEGEFRIVRPDGTVRVLHSRGEVLSEPDGRPRSMLGVCLDITKRKRTDQEVQSLLTAVQREKETLSAVLNGISDEVWFADTTGKFTLANPSAVRAFSLEPAKGIGVVQLAASLEVLRPDGSPRPVEEAPPLRALQGETVRDQEERVRTPASGELRYRQVSAAPVKDAQGAIIGSVSVVRDITEQKRAQEALRFVGECGWGPSGEDFFRGLARYLAQSLGANFVCIDRIQEGSLTAQTVAVLSDGKFQDNVTYALKDTPCGDVVGKTICCFPRDVRGLFPKDAVLQELLAEGYVGTTLWSAVGQPIGLIALIWRKPLADTRLVTSVLQIVAVRAAGELERRQVEAALRKSEALALSEKEFRLLAEAMPQIVWATRADGWNTYFNQQWVDYTGLTLEESYGPGWNKPFHPDDQQRAWDTWQNAVTNRATYSLECRLRRVDGTYRWWLIRGVPVVDEKGTVLKWFGTCTDINDFKRAEQALREAGEERLRLVLEATSMGTFEVDLRTGEGRWNTVEFELLGLKPGDAPSVPATFFRYLHPDDAARVQAQWSEATQTGFLNAEFRIVRADGQVRWLAGLGRFAYAGKPGDSAPEGKREPVRFLGVNFDITERKEMEETLRESESRYRAIGESIDYGVWVCAPNGRNIYASPSFLKLVGLTQEQCSNFGWGEVLHPDDTARTISAWEECVRTGGRWDIEHRFRGVDGKYHPVLARGVPVRNDRGEILCWVGINLDISRLKDAEEELRRRAEELRVSNDELNRFNEAMVGRELRMIELKREIDVLCAQLGQPPRYGPISGEEAPPSQCPQPDRS